MVLLGCLNGTETRRRRSKNVKNLRDVIYGWSRADSVRGENSCDKFSHTLSHVQTWPPIENRLTARKITVQCPSLSRNCLERISPHVQVLHDDANNCISCEIMLHLRNTVHSSGVSENGLERSREWACIRYLIGEYDTSRPESNSVDVIIKQREGRERE